MADLTGRQFGRLTIVGPAGQDLPAVTGGWWTARCVCGREMTAPAEAYQAGRLTGCGRPTPEQRADHDRLLADIRPVPEVVTVATRTRQRPNVGHREVPWARFVRTDCACDDQVPCLIHFDDLDWRARALAWARAGVTPPTGR